MATAMIMAMAMVASVAKVPDGRRSRRRGWLGRRSRVEWVMRGATAAVAAVAGYGAVTFSLAGVVKSDPARAYALAPYDGRLTGRLAAAIGDPEADAAARRESDVLARSALRQDPTAVAAASALGFNAQARGDLTFARRAFSYAEHLSRRDPTTQLWAIEDAVARGDVKGAMRHYDIALRVKPELGGLLFPVLAAASGVPSVQPELVRTLSAKPLWAEAFVNYVAIGNGSDPRTIAALFQRLTASGMALPEPATAGLVRALFADGHVAEAWAYYASLRRGARRDRSRDPGFTTRLIAPSPFDWIPIDDGGVVGSTGAGAFDFSAPPSVGGPMLRQAQLLPPGKYRLTGRAADIDQPSQAQPYWVLACSNGRELGRLDIANSPSSGGGFAGEFEVPLDCPIQTLTLIARPAETVGGLSGRVTRASLVPSR